MNIYTTIAATTKTEFVAWFKGHTNKYIRFYHFQPFPSFFFIEYCRSSWHFINIYLFMSVCIALKPGAYVSVRFARLHHERKILLLQWETWKKEMKLRNSTNPYFVFHCAMLDGMCITEHRHIFGLIHLLTPHGMTLHVMKSFFMRTVYVDKLFNKAVEMIISLRFSIYSWFYRKSGYL